MTNMRLYLVKFFPLVLILSFAVTQYILIFRHKSPHLSDSYFYKHIYYEMQGYSYKDAQKKVLSQVDLTGADNITVNFFTKDESYRNSLSFFTKRPFYPVTAAFISVFTSSEFVAFVLPVFVAYIASITLSFYFFKKGLNYFFATFSLALFISFHPFLDWSTYFLTDTIGFAFWLAQLFIIYQYFKNGNPQLLLIFAALFGLSLLNREQSFLILPLLFVFWSALKIFGFSNKEKTRILKLFLITLVAAGLYLLIVWITGQRTLLDTLAYTQNNYGLFQKEYTIFQTGAYVADAVVRSHVAVIGDLTRNHWWFVIFVLGILGILKIIFFDTKKKFIDLILLSSGVVSYISIFLYPVLSYRFFFPVVIMIIYFASRAISDFFQNKNYVPERERTK